MLQGEQMHKMTSISLTMFEVVILSENSHFVSCSVGNNSYVGFFLEENSLYLVSGCQFPITYVFHDKACFNLFQVRVS